MIHSRELVAIHVSDDVNLCYNDVCGSGTNKHIRYELTLEVLIDWRLAQIGTE